MGLLWVAVSTFSITLAGFPKKAHICLQFHLMQRVADVSKRCTHYYFAPVVEVGRCRL